MLDDRKAAILRAVVEHYIETAQPAGSSTIANIASVGVSSATVRNEMSVLEQEGYLQQPHTSAGRVPTEKGYRFFVDRFTNEADLGDNQVAEVRDFFATQHGELERMLSDTSRLLSHLTTHAAVVVGPPHEVASVRSAQMVKLSDRVLLVVVILSNGAVEKHTIELAESVGDERVGAASVRLATALTGHAINAIPELVSTGDAAVDSLVEVSIQAITRQGDDNVYVDGTSNIASSFDAVDTVRSVLRILEQQLVVVTLFRNVLDRGLNVAIGSETGIEPLAECALVVAPYIVDGEPAGTIGILGPTRMNYPQALAAVAVVGRQLGTRLSQHEDT